MFQITQNAFKMVSPVVHSTSHDIIMTRCKLGLKSPNHYILFQTQNKHVMGLSEEIIVQYCIVRKLC